jgi:hypothetical protein
MSSPEVDRLFEPVRAPSFWRYLWEKNHWAYASVPASLVAVVTVDVSGLDWWWSAGTGVLLGLSVENAAESWSHWRQNVQLIRDTAKRVDEWSSGRRGFPRPLAQAIVNLINEDKVPLAAAIALEHLRETDPQARAWLEEFDALPEDEKKRRRDAAIAMADEDISKNTEGH